MAGYIKRIALIKTVKRGFSADGNDLSGLIKCETYAGFLKAEASLINFSPLTEGRYCIGLSDGSGILFFEGSVFEGEVKFNLSCGFAALVCFCNNGVFPVASAVCGDMTEELARIERKMVEREGVRKCDDSRTAFADEAIAEENYYELEIDESGGAVCENAPQEKDGRTGDQNEAYTRPVENQSEAGGSRRFTCKSIDEQCFADENKRQSVENGRPLPENKWQSDDDKGQADRPRLADGDFYERMKGDVKKIFYVYPKEERLERVIEGSRWARIGYGSGKYYAFGVIYDGSSAKYICYAVPSADSSAPPPALAGRASYIPVEGGGFWVMYQDAQTGVGSDISLR